jgi:hypothetical protein
MVLLPLPQSKSMEPLGGKVSVQQDIMNATPTIGTNTPD